MKLSDKRILITGGTRGIGLAIAKAMANSDDMEGAQIAITGRREADLAKAVAEIGSEVKTIAADLAKPSAPQALAEAAIETLGGVDVLVNNAGMQFNYSFFDRSYDDIAKDLDTFSAPVKLAAALLPHMAERDSAAIVNVTSGLAIAPKEGAPIYCASKAGLRSFTRALRYQAETQTPHIKVVDVILPLVNTDMTKGRGSGKIEPEDVARQIISGLASGQDEIWVGKARLLKTLIRVAPNRAYKILRG